MWEEVKNPKGIVLIIHSIKQNGLNYSGLAEYLNKNNYIVCATDIRLHGKLASNENTKQQELPKHTDIFKEIVSDHFVAVKYLNDKYSLPITILGHGFGAYVAKRLIQICDYAKNVVLSGMAYNMSPFMLKLKTTSNFFGLLKNTEKTNKKFEKYFYGAMQKRVVIGNWYSINEEVYEDYLYESKDILLPLSFYRAWLNNIVVRDKNLLNINAKTRVLIMCGSYDPFTMYENEQNKIVKQFNEAGVQPQLNIFDGFKHNLYEDEESDMIFKVVLQFING